MKKVESLLIVSELIAKKIVNGLSNREKSELESWLNDTWKNEKFYKKIISGHNFSERNRFFENIDTNKSYENFEKKLNREKRRSIKINNLLKYVAAIILPLTITVGILWYTKNKQNITIQEHASTIQPGSRTAVLILNDGSTVNLENKEITEFQEEDGTAIKRRNDELVYSAKTKPVKEELLMNTLTVPRGGEYSLVLSDSSRIYVNSMSELTFPVRFVGNKREVTLRGEAYFEVAEDKSCPFIVNINGMKIEVLGTSFNVKAYEDDQDALTTLVEGSIKVNLSDKSSKSWIIEPNQQVVFNKSKSDISIHEVDPWNYIQWKNGVYYFINQPLDQIIHTLSRWYDFEYSFMDESLKEIKFEGGLNKYENIDPILDIITSTNKVKINVANKKIVFMKP